MNDNGIIAIENVVNRNASGGYRIVQDVTTYNSTNEKVKSLVSLQELTDFLFDDLRIYLEKNFIGTSVRQTTGSLIASYVEAYLQRMVKQGLLASYDHDTIQCVMYGEQAFVSFTCMPSRELTLIYVRGTYSNYSSSTSSADGQTSDGLPMTGANATVHGNGINPDTTSVSGLIQQNQQGTSYI